MHTGEKSLRSEVTYFSDNVISVFCEYRMQTEDGGLYYFPFSINYDISSGVFLKLCDVLTEKQIAECRTKEFSKNSMYSFYLTPDSVVVYKKRRNSVNLKKI